MSQHTSTPLHDLIQDVPDTLLGRAFHLLRTLSIAHPEQLALSDLARQAGLPKTTTHRLLKMLEDSGAVERAGGNYRTLWRRPGAVMHREGSSANLRGLLLPTLLEIYKTTHGTVHLAVLDGPEARIVEKLADRDAVEVPTRPGMTVPTHCTAIGKVLLAYTTTAVAPGSVLTRHTSSTLTSVADLHVELARVRERGLAVDRGEYVRDVACVAAPVFDRSGNAIAAISVSRPKNRLEFVGTGQLIQRVLMRIRPVPVPGADRSAFARIAV